MPVSERFTAAMNASETEEVPLVFLEISHPDLDETLRFVNNSEDITRLGSTYYAFPFGVEPPNQDPDQMSTATLTIGNVVPDDDGDLDPGILQQWRKGLGQLRALTGYITVSMALALAATPDETEMDFGKLTIDSITGDAMTLKAQLSLDSVYNEPYPGDVMSPGLFPGIF